jgi:hypothetical protein
MVDSELIQKSLSGFFTRVAELLPTILLGMVLLLLGWFVARLVSSLIGRLARRIGVDRLIDETGLATGV